MSGKIFALGLCGLGGILRGTGHVLAGALLSYVGGVIIGYIIAPNVKRIITKY